MKKSIFYVLVVLMALSLTLGAVSAEDAAADVAAADDVAAVDVAFSLFRQKLMIRLLM